MQIASETFDPNLFDTHQVHQVYNGMDCCLTMEILNELRSMRNSEPVNYGFSRALQGPILEIMLRGFRVDRAARNALVAVLREERGRLNLQFQKMCFAAFDLGVNPNSTTQLQDIFYKKMHLPEIWSSKKGKRGLSMDRATLEKLTAYYHATPFVNHILAIRERDKLLQMLETEISADGRYRTSYNIAGTETSRLSSSSWVDDTGGNAQNMPPFVRRVFVADPGFRLYCIDLEQAESREVGLICGLTFDDWTYLDACEAGDLHTFASRLIWPEMLWTGDIKLDRKIADQNFYRDFSYRDMAKRGGHGCLTEDHEVLTPDGWVSITAKPKTIMTFDQHKGSMFADVSFWLDQQYTGDMVEVEDQALSFKVTGKHRILGTTDPYSGAMRDYAANSMPKSIQIPKGWGYVSNGGNHPMNLARFLAAFHSDGHQKTTNRCEFHFHKARKIQQLKDLCSDLGLEYEHKPKQNKILVHISLPQNKRDTWPTFDWSAEAIEAYVDEYPNWDGYKGAKGHVTVTSVNLDFIQLFQTFARLIGKGGNWRKLTSGFGSTVYELHLNNRKFALPRNIKSTQEALRVLCPSVPSTYFYIRRNGKISVTGNTSYYGTPFTMAMHLKVPPALMVAFQRRFFDAFPAIPRWHQDVATRLQTTSVITNNFEVDRAFYGRPGDDTTLREAIAHGPQSSTAFRTNLGLWRIWDRMGKRVQLLGQTHDSITFQAPEVLPPGDVIAEALDCMSIPIKTPSGRVFDVPGEAKVGWNWAPEVSVADQEAALRSGRKVPKLNLNGLRKWKGADSRVRLGILDEVN